MQIIYSFEGRFDIGRNGIFIKIPIICLYKAFIELKVHFYRKNRIFIKNPVDCENKVGFV